MNTPQLTFTQSAKILWSYIWRAWIMMMPLAIVAMVIARFVAPFPRPGEPPQPMDPKFWPYFIIACLS